MKSAYAVGCVLVAAALIAGVTQPALARERTYYIAAEEITWNYVPSGRDLIFNKALPQLGSRLGWTYRKLVYRAYANAAFTAHVPRSDGERYLGILGPVLHAEVGDRMVVTFKNNTHLPLDLQPSGGLIGSTSHQVRPGSVHTYRWTVPASAGPGPGDDSSTLWTYDAGGANANATENAGLQGAIIITRRGAARADGSPADVDREIFAVFRETDETSSVVFPESLADPHVNPRRITRSAKSLAGDNTFVNINGYSFGNMPMIALHRGERVRWYAFTSNNTNDFHMPTWNGQTVVIGGHRADTTGVTPGSTTIADMTPDNPGVWMFYCTLNVHLKFGMSARFEVRK